MGTPLCRLLLGGLHECVFHARPHTQLHKCTSTDRARSIPRYSRTAPPHPPPPPSTMLHSGLKCAVVRVVAWLKAQGLEGTHTHNNPQS